jgi:hypothetical protein
MTSTKERRKSVAIFKENQIARGSEKINNYNVNLETPKQKYTEFKEAAATNENRLLQKVGRKSFENTFLSKEPKYSAKEASIVYNNSAQAAAAEGGGIETDPATNDLFTAKHVESYTAQIIGTENVAQYMAAMEEKEGSSLQDRIHTDSEGNIVISAPHPHKHATNVFMNRKLVNSGLIATNVIPSHISKPAYVPSFPYSRFKTNAVEPET